MPALCGPLGPMICLNGATCNETTGLCENCPAGFYDDQTLFLGNQNCGLNPIAAYIVYSFTGIFAIIVSVAGFWTVATRQRSRLQRIFLLIGIWNGMIPFYLLSHYLAGFRFSVATVVLFITTLLIANVQVALFVASLESFMALACNYSKLQELQRNIVIINAFWLFNKVAFGLIMLIGVATEKYDIFNAAQVGLFTSMVLEISLNIIRLSRTSWKIVEGVRALHSDLNVTGNINPVVVEFAKRIEDNRCIGHLYGIIYFLFAAALPILFGIYQSSIPYEVVIWAAAVMTWPIIGAGPLIALGSKLGKQLDKDSKSAVADTSLTPAALPGSAANPKYGSADGDSLLLAQSPLSAMASSKKTLKAAEVAEAVPDNFV